MKTFSARETLWLQELDGIELAGFWPRAIALTIDGILSSIAISLFAILFVGGYLGVRHLQGKPFHITDVNQLNEFFGEKTEINATPTPSSAPATSTTNPSSHFHVNYAAGEPEHEHPHTLLGEAIHIVSDIVIPILYFGIFLWKGNGRTPGKRLMKIRVVSLVHTHISFWHAVERALGYGAAALEGGFGFIQFFLHPYRRCAQDRLAETIVVTERSYQQKFPPALGTPSEADTQLQ